MIASSHSFFRSRDVPMTCHICSSAHGPQSTACEWLGTPSGMRVLSQKAHFQPVCSSPTSDYVSETSRLPLRQPMEPYTLWDGWTGCGRWSLWPCSGCALALFYIIMEEMKRPFNAHTGKVKRHKERIEKRRVRDSDQINKCI